MSDQLETKLITPNKNRPTIGVIVDSMISGYQITLWRGIKSAAEKFDVNVICFLGREINSTVEFRQQANAVYNLVNEKSIDGLISLTGTISHFVDEADLEAYLQRFQPLPIVNIAEEVSKMPSIVLDNPKGIHDMMEHLIDVHHYQKIGYVRMREGHTEGDIRFEAYKEALKGFGLPYDPDLVVPGDYYDQPEAIVSLLYDERKVHPEAIVISDDYMALPIMEILQNRGISIPQDVAIVGFDDIEEARYIDPQLTTLRQPLLEQAHQAVEIVLAAIRGDTVPLKIELSPQLVIRQSCGCSPASIANAAASQISSIHEGATWAEYQPKILASLLEISELADNASIQTLLESLIDAIQTSSTESFLSNLNQILLQSEGRDEDILEWQSIISGLRPFVINILQSKPELFHAENLIQQSRVMIAEAARRNQARRRLKIQDLNLSFRNLSQALNTTMNFDDLMDVLDQELPQIGIPAFFISSYANNNPEADRLNLILAHTQNGRQELPPEGLQYSATELLPSEYLQGDQRSAKLVQPLYFRDEQYGFVVFEAQSFDESIYDALAEQISSGIKGTQLVQQVEQRAVQLLTAAEVSRAASSILEPEELLQNIVNLVKERFDLYYVGIFLVDENLQWAVLRAGTGEAGKNMLAENWRLDVGGGSMIGRCIESGEADIQLDIDQAPVHLRNPHLPETKSEIALPLSSRGETIGALTIQSTQAGAFTSEDIVILQSMADQLANALINARLYDSLAREQAMMQALMDNFPESIYFKDTESRFLGVSKYMVRNFGVEHSSEIIGKTDFDFFTEEHAQAAYDLEQQIINTGEPVLNLEERETWEDRPDTWVATSKLPLNNERGEIVGTFGVSLNITARKEAEILLEQQSNQLQNVIEVSRAVSEILDPENLPLQIVDLIRDYFDLYYVGLYLLDDERKLAVLRAGTGEAGKKMLQENWRLKVDSRSIIGRSIIERYADLNLDLDEVPEDLRNPYLPQTRIEIALPLISRNEVLGALSIHFDQRNAVTKEDINIFQTMANQAAIAISNANLIEQTQAALEEIQAIQRRYQIQAWSTYNQTRTSSGYQKTMDGLVPLGKQKISEVDQAIQDQAPVISKDGEIPKLTIPIMLRDQPIGAIGIQAADGERKWSTDEIDLAKEISEQFALAAESIRLLDETQRRAARERLVAEITTKIRASNNPESMIQTAAEELRTALKVKRTQVVIQPNSITPDPLERGEE